MYMNKLKLTQIWYRIIRMKSVAGWRIIDYYHFAKVSSQLIQVFYIISFEKYTRFTEKAGAKYSPFIQKIGNRISILKHISQNQERITEYLIYLSEASSE